MNISALIVTYNRLDKLKKTWAASKLLPFNHIVIIDNASTDGTADWLGSLDDARLSVITSPKNDGGAGGFYCGAEWIAKNIDADWVMVFDDDAYPTPDLLDTFDEIDKQGVDAFATKVITPSGMRCKMNIPWKKIPNSLTEIISYQKNDTDFVARNNDITPICTFSFVGLIIKHDVLKETYYNINKDLFIYYDDIYYSWYLNSSGFKLVYRPELVFIHDVPESDITPPPWKVYYLVRNLLLSFKIFNNNRPFSHISILFRVFKYFLMVLKSQSKINFAKAIFLGIKDGFSKK